MTCLSTSTTMRRMNVHPPNRPTGMGIFGSILLLIGAIMLLALLAMRDRPLGGAIPRLIDRQPTVWFGLSLLILMGGIAVLRQEHEASPDWKPTRPGRRFRRASVYTRPNCPLCDTATDVLLHYTPYLPPIEFIDIEGRPELADRFGNCVPVLELDGRVRFRGKISEPLLRRLIEGTPPARDSETS